MMNIVIVVHSLTGNTYYVARKMKEKLAENGHSVTIERIEAEGNADKAEMNPNKLHLTSLPEVSSYDLIIIGGPVRGFSISPVVAAFLANTKSLQGKKIICMVTQFFPFPWLGGNRAIRQMKSICKSKGGAIVGTGIVNWNRSKRENKIIELVESLSKVV
jgi:flavodoxin